MSPKNVELKRQMDLIRRNQGWWTNTKNTIRLLGKLLADLKKTKQRYLLSSSAFVRGIGDGVTGLTLGVAGAVKGGANLANRASRALLRGTVGYVPSLAGNNIYNLAIDLVADSQRNYINNAVDKYLINPVNKFNLSIQQNFAQEGNLNVSPAYWGGVLVPTITAGKGLSKVKVLDNKKIFNTVRKIPVLKQVISPAARGIKLPKYMPKFLRRGAVKYTPKVINGIVDTSTIGLPLADFSTGMLHLNPQDSHNKKILKRIVKDVQKPLSFLSPAKTITSAMLLTPPFGKEFYKGLGRAGATFSPMLLLEGSNLYSKLNNNDNVKKSISDFLQKKKELSGTIFKDRKNSLLLIVDVILTINGANQRKLNPYMAVLKKLTLRLPANIALRVTGLQDFVKNPVTKALDPVISKAYNSSTNNLSYIPVGSLLKVMQNLRIRKKVIGLKNNTLLEQNAPLVKKRILLVTDGIRNSLLSRKVEQEYNKLNPRQKHALLYISKKLGMSMTTLLLKYNLNKLIFNQLKEKVKSGQ